MLKLAGCIIEEKQGKILLLHRNTSGRVQWETPGGKIEEGEDSQVAAIREVKEELGVDVSILGKLGEHLFEEDGHAMHYIWYRAKITSGTPSPQEAKFDKLQAFSWLELRAMFNDLSPNTKNLVVAYESGEIAKL
jgi:8-oxo-dGTP diphosphatase